MSQLNPLTEVAWTYPAKSAFRGCEQEHAVAPAVRLLSFLRERGGVLVGGQRSMASALGWSKTRFNEVLHELKARGLIKLDTRPTGTFVRLTSMVSCSTS